MSSEMADSFLARLRRHPLRRQLVDHKVFRQIRSEGYDRKQALILVGQWWHPLHYFPTFLALSVAAFPDIRSKSAAAHILDQETGEGRPERAHEVVYIDSLSALGFTREEITELPPFAETEALVASYAEATQNQYSARGFIFATEVADLAMVTGIGEAVRRATGAQEIEWVRIHAQQEPAHVAQADNSLLQEFSENEEFSIMESAGRMWSRWIAFFDRVSRETTSRALIIS